MASAGFDSLKFPGPDAMKWLKAKTNLKWCGYYLAPAPNRPDSGWMGQRAALAANGWGIAPLFVGEQDVHADPKLSRDPSAAHGTRDGNAAVAQLAAEGFPDGTNVFLDLEDGTPPNQAMQDYVKAFVAAVLASGRFNPGIYCSYLIVNPLVSLCGDDIAGLMWVFKVTDNGLPFGTKNFPEDDPSGSGYAAALIWQYTQKREITAVDPAVDRLTIDLDTALFDDPGSV